ncbi:hypothetical protein [Blastococcus sp. URHD0036]|uniref:hypothetical protein n=1 Tax=Blastococcus sp. URHD0036 TaxID=1380356 RepID=UPI00054FE10B|nr:hypothetical protein [Blastococcus sp. URHD0036]
MTGAELRRAAAAARELLASVPDGSARVPAMDDDVAGVTAHVTGCLIWYAQDLAVGPEGADGFTLGRRPEAALPELVRQQAAAAEVLARTVEGAAPGDRGRHDWGRPDASGFAAMGAAELLLHTADVAAALDLSWRPPADLADAVVVRLFPWAPSDTEPVATLLWATGRADLPGHEPVTSWRWHCSPLEEWDGTRAG